MAYYAGIGARATPPFVLKVMTSIGYTLGIRGEILRSGGAAGADSAFEKGCDEANGNKEIFTAHSFIPDWAFEITKRTHPAPEKLSPFVMRLHARNALILLGREMDRPVERIICWTPKGEVVGGTGQALRIAQLYGIPVQNLYNEYNP